MPISSSPRVRRGLQPLIDVTKDKDKDKDQTRRTQLPGAP